MKPETIRETKVVWLLAWAALLVEWTALAAPPATGPLRVNAVNLRYFTDGTEGGRISRPAGLGVGEFHARQPVSVHGSLS